MQNTPYGTAMNLKCMHLHTFQQLYIYSMYTYNFNYYIMQLLSQNSRILFEINIFSHGFWGYTCNSNYTCACYTHIDT